MTDPLVSVVVPAYNRESLLPRALDSVLAQTYDHWECIVSDNASTDGSLSVAEEYARRDTRFRVLRNPTNDGPVANWLRGTLEARGDLVKLLFSDDWMDKECLEAAVRAFDENADLGFVYFAVEYENQTAVDASREDGLQPSRLFLWRSLVSHGDVPVSPTAGVFRRDDVVVSLDRSLRDERFDYEGTGAGYDQTIYLDAAEHSPYVYFVGSSSVHYGTGPESITMTVNATRPGHLLWGYLQAQLAFLDRRRRAPIENFIARGAIRFYLLKLFVRHRLLARFFAEPNVIVEAP